MLFCALQVIDAVNFTFFTLGSVLANSIRLIKHKQTPICYPNTDLERPATIKVVLQGFGVVGGEEDVAMVLPAEAHQRVAGFAGLGQHAVAGYGAGAAVQGTRPGAFEG